MDTSRWAPQLRSLLRIVAALSFVSHGSQKLFAFPVSEPQPTVISIGPVTSATAREHGLRVDAEATEHTIDGLVSALLTALHDD